jgi:hypothetical protein
MADNCKKCGKSIGLFSTIEVEGQKYCVECSNAVKADKNVYIPEIDAIHRALSALLTQDPDTKKLFEEGSSVGWVAVFLATQHSHSFLIKN